MDWIAQINDWLDAHDLYPEVEAVGVVDRPDVFVLIDEQESTVYRSPEECYRELTLLGDDADFEEAGQTLAQYMLPDGENGQELANYLLPDEE